MTTSNDQTDGSDLSQARSTQSTLILSPDSPVLDHTWGTLYFDDILPEGYTSHTIRLCEQDSYSFGRSSLCDFVLKHRLISRHHCTIGFDRERRCMYLQNECKTGTYVKVSGKSRAELLTHNDEISLPEHAQIILALGSKQKNMRRVQFSFTRERDVDVADEIFERFEIVRELGRGGYGVVRLGRSFSTGERFAIKSVNKLKWEREARMCPRRPRSLLDEVTIMQHLTHKNILQVHEVVDSRCEVHIVMDYCAGGDLLECILEDGPLSEDRARIIFKQVVSAVGYLHQQGVVHRDLKPENILLCEEKKDDIKLADFGASRFHSLSQQCVSRVGTKTYQAPEIGEHSGPYGKAADIWSLGVTLYVMLSGMKITDDPRELWKLSRNRIIPFPADPWARRTKSVLHLICAMLTYDPSLRIRAGYVQNHPWMLGQSDIPLDYDHSFGRKRKKSGVSGSERRDGRVGKKRRREENPERPPKRHRSETFTTASLLSSLPSSRSF